MQELLKLGDRVSLLRILLPHEDVHSRVVDRGLDDEGVAAQAQAALLGEVTVDDRVVEVLERADQLRTLNLVEGEVLQLRDGVDVDVALTLGDGHEALGGQQAQRALLVGGVGDDADRAAVGQLVQGLVLLGEDAEGLEVNTLAGLEIVAGLLLRVLQVGDGLVEVGVELTVVERRVGLHVVGVLNDIELDALGLGQVVVDVGEDLRVGRGGRAHGQGHDVRGGAGAGSIRG